MSLDLLHDATFGLLYFCLFIALAVVIERSLFMWTAEHFAHLEDLANTPAPADRKVSGGASQVIHEAIKEFDDMLPLAKHEQQREAATLIAFTQVRSALVSRLWLLDTVVTAAPLLGLLGTILGIISTFVALAASGVSDSERVAAGIGTALYATALGIGIATCAVVALNWLNNRTEVLCDRFKHLLAISTIRFFQA
jgi:biopolymer transport protein ExbB